MSLGIYPYPTNFLKYPPIRGFPHNSSLFCFFIYVAVSEALGTILFMVPLWQRVFCMDARSLRSSTHPLSSPSVTEDGVCAHKHGYRLEDVQLNF